MRLANHLLIGVAAAGLAVAASAASADEPIGKGLVMYMQMGGNPGDGATLARQTGAAQAAAALGVELKSQFSAWAPETMINQFKEAMAAKPNCIEIMGHPGTPPSMTSSSRRRSGHRRHRRQFAVDRSAEGVRTQGLRLCRASISTPAAR